MNKKSKLFYIENNPRKYILNILGLKLTFSKIKKKINEFNKNNSKYINKSTKNKTKRIFFTSGNLSLLNTISIIKQLNASNCEDTLVIVSHLTNENFEKAIKIMSSLHNFKKIYTYFHSDDIDLFILNNQLYDYDEVYYSHQLSYVHLMEKLYTNSKLIMTDEGPNGKLKIPNVNYENVTKMIMHEYLDNKIDSFGFSDEIKKKIIPLDKSIFLDVANSCAKECPVNINTKEDEKIILLCGLWWENTGLTKEEYIELQETYIQKFLEKGYTLWFKPHPRDNRDYIKNDKVKILQTALPLECYRFDNVVATVSFLSTSSLFSYYFSNIPGFQIKKVNIKQSDCDITQILVKEIVQDYAPSIEYLLDLDTKHLSLFETKEKIKDVYLNYMNKLPNISENKDMIKLANELGYKFC